MTVRPGPGSGWGLTQIAQQWQQVCGVAEPQGGKSEGHRGREERHGEVLNELSGQTLLQQVQVGGHFIRQQDEHADVVLHLDLSDLVKDETPVNIVQEINQKTA